MFFPIQKLLLEVEFLRKSKLKCTSPSIWESAGLLFHINLRGHSFFFFFIKFTSILISSVIAQVALYLLIK